MKTIIRLEALTIGYAVQKAQQKIIARHINTDLHAGELVCLLGPNGAGKSTLMRTMSGMQAPLSGQVLLAGKPLQQIPSRSLARQLSVVLTDKVETGLLTAYEVVALGRYPYTSWSGKLSVTDHEVIHRAIEMTGAEELAKRAMHELSDGERQKIMMARALAQQPDVMILDEVTAFLDLPRRVDFMQLLRRLARESGCAILLSTHDLDLALRAADRIWLLPKGGTLTLGAPEDLVLNGAFEQAFAGEGVCFDRQTGTFQMHTPLHENVRLIATGDMRWWTQRALERQGFSISADTESASLTVEVDCQQGKPVWKLTKQGQLQSCDSIYQLLQSVSNR